MQTNRSKKWLLVGSSVLGVVALGVIAYFMFFGNISKEQYAEAATNAKQVSEQYEIFETAAQKYISLANSKIEPAVAEELSSTMQSSLAKLKESKEVLSKSAALRDPKVKAAYHDYEKKAEKADALSEQYAVSIPLFATMYSTCLQITHVDASNVLSQLKLYAEWVQAQTKEETLAVFDKKSSACIAAAAKLKDSGDNMVANIGEAFYVSLTDTRKAVATRFDELSTLGAKQAEANYDVATQKIESETEERIAKASVKQKDAQAFDYKEEIQKLQGILESKSH